MSLQQKYTMFILISIVIHYFWKIKTLLLQSVIVLDMYKNICFIIAMEAEAFPFIKQMNLVEDKLFAPQLPMRLWSGRCDGKLLSVVINGKDTD